MRRLHAIAMGVVGLLTALFICETLGVRINLAASMPVGIYRLAPCGKGVGDALRRGDLAAIDTEVAARANAKVRFFRERGYLTFTGSPRDLLLKEVTGVGADVIEDLDGSLLVDGRALTDAASFRSRTARGEVLPEISFPYRLARGELWLSSEHVRGIDSRYFGGVASDAVKCRVEVLWTR